MRVNGRPRAGKIGRGEAFLPQAERKLSAAIWLRVGEPIQEQYARSTVAAYEQYAPPAIANWSRHRRPSRFLQEFARCLPSGARILDYGCGIGTDLAWMRRQGFTVEGIDGTEHFVREARRRCSGARIRLATFESVRLPRSSFDGVWCQASLLHVPPHVLQQQLHKLRSAMRPLGWLGISLAWGRTHTVTKGDWIPGRYIWAYSKTQAAGFFAGWSVQQLRVVSHDGRQGRWIHILARPSVEPQKPASPEQVSRARAACGSGRRAVSDDVTLMREQAS